MHLTAYSKTLWKIARPRTLILIALHGVLGYVFLTKQAPDTMAAVLCVVAMVCAYMHAVAVNDISDEVVDALNRKQLAQDNDRPLLDRTVTTKQLWLLSHGIAAAWLIVSFCVGWQLLVVTMVLIILNFIYSLPPWRLSYRGVLAQLFLPLMYVAYPLFMAALLAHTVTIAYFFLGLSLYVLFVGRLFLKDIRDEKGDAEAGKRTFLVRHGLKRTVWCAAACIIVGSIGVTAVVTVSIGLSVLPPVCLAAVIGISHVSRNCLRQKRLALQLLDVAVIGRMVSMVIFVALVAIVAVSYGSLNTLQVTAIELAAVAVFLFGIIGLYEERRATKKA